MKKDFNIWHIQKSNIDEYKERPFCHEREVWFTSLGLNVGFEQDGRGKESLRPVVIIKKFNNSMVWAVPLTRSLKDLDEKKKCYYFDFVFMESISRAILSQVRPIDTKRLQYKVGDIKEVIFTDIKQRITQLFV